MTTDQRPTEPKSASRRAAMRTALAAGAVTGAAWAAPAIRGTSLIPGAAGAAGASDLTPITVEGTATKSVGCFGGAGSNDQFLTTLGTDGWWHFYFQGCGLTESVALADPIGGPTANAYQPPTGYRCKMQLISGGSVVYDTGYVSDPINGIADTGGYVFIGTSAYPNGIGNMSWKITCDPV
jgi:hypothetical protein